MKTFKEFVKSTPELDEAYMRDAADHNLGDTIHPVNDIGRYLNPHRIMRKLPSKTIIQDKVSGDQYEISNASGKVKHQKTGKEEKYRFAGFDTPEEKKEKDDRKLIQRNKDDAHHQIHKLLSGMQNYRGDVVGKLSPEAHSEILSHLETLKS